MPLDSAETRDNWSLIGHSWAVRFLRLSLLHDRISHAYLITGPARVGKTTLAVSMAKALNCESEEAARTGIPCNECRSCRQIDRGSHPDVRLIGMSDQAALLRKDATKQKELGIGTIREFVVQSASNMPLMGRKKVYIIEGADKLSEEAANAMLKTLEEGNRFNVIILLADSDARIFPTIMSRCQRIGLRPVPSHEVKQGLVSRGVEGEQAELLSILSHGSPGWALGVVADASALRAHDELVETAQRLLQYNRSDRISLAEVLAKAFGSGKKDLVAGTLDSCTDWWRDLLLLKVGCSDLVTNVDHRQTLAAQAGFLEIDEIQRSIAAVSEAVSELDMNVNPRLALEALFLRLPYLQCQ